MGPLECESPRQQPPAFATSVFTVLYPYADIINDTVHNTRHAVQMIKLTDNNGCVSPLNNVVLELVVCFCILFWYPE